MVEVRALCARERGLHYSTLRLGERDVVFRECGVLAQHTNTALSGHDVALGGRQIV
jgi:hypothetical protein